MIPPTVVAVQTNSDEWNLGTQVGSYQKSEFLYNTIFENNPPVGTTFLDTVTEITDKSITVRRTFPDSPETAAWQNFGGNERIEREGYIVFSGATVHSLTTNNVDHLQEILRLNASGIRELNVNDTHFWITDYFFMAAHHGFPDHYHSYNGTYNRVTGWLEYMEVSHVAAETGELIGIIRIKGFESGWEDTDEIAEVESTDSGGLTFSWNSMMLVLSVVFGGLLKHRNLRNLQNNRAWYLQRRELN